MSSTNFTPNYSLSQFLPNDTPNWFDINGDMQKIDTALHNLSQVAEPAEKAIQALTTRVEKEEAQSQLQAEQIVDLQTSMNRNTEKVNQMGTRVDNLNGNVNSLTTQVEALTNSGAGTAADVTSIQTSITTINTRLEGLDTVTAANTAAAAAAQQAADKANDQLNDFGMIENTAFTLAEQFTGSLDLLTTWHNTREILFYGVEVHDLEALQEITVDNITDTAYLLAAAPGKLFNTNWPAGSEEQPNTTANIIGTIWQITSETNAATPINVYWHYDVTNNQTQLLVAFPENKKELYKTGPLFGNVTFIQD